VFQEYILRIFVVQKNEELVQKAYNAFNKCCWENFNQSVSKVQDAYIKDDDRIDVTKHLEFK